MANFWQIVTGAPWWVYVLFVYLLIIGIKSIKPRTVAIKKIVLIPFLFFAWSVYNLYAAAILGFPSLIAVWAVAIGLGTLLGIWEVRSWKIGVDRKKATITIPGNYSSLLLMILIFLLKFFWGTYYAIHPSVSYGIYFSDILSTSVLSGFFVGRASYFFKTYHKN